MPRFTQIPIAKIPTKPLARESRTGKPPVNKQIFDGVPKSWTHAPAPEKSSNVKDPATENKIGK
jgi:hypothetical protein